MDNCTKADVVRAQYQSSDMLQVRKALHARFNVADEPFFEWIFARIPLYEGARVLECGCGDGALWRENLSRIPANMRVTLTDFSDGMLAAAKNGLPESFAFRQADITALPFGDGAFDTVIANHMLYHVPDIDKAVSEVRRALAPKGTFVCSTAGADNLRELWEMCAELDASCRAPEISFNLENGASYLEKRFNHVELMRYPSSLYVTDARAICEYIASMADFCTVRPGALTALEQRLNERITAEGGITIRKTAGLFRCTN